MAIGLHDTDMLIVYNDRSECGNDCFGQNSGTPCALWIVQKRRDRFEEGISESDVLTEEATSVASLSTNDTIW